MASLPLAAPALVRATVPTSQLGVSATVVASATVGGGNVAVQMASGDYDVAHGSNGTAAITITLTAASSALIRLGGGTNSSPNSKDDAPVRNMAANGVMLRYEIYRDAGFTVPWGNTPATALERTGTGAPDTVTIYVRVLPGQRVPAGTYTDTVLISVDY